MSLNLVSPPGRPALPLPLIVALVVVVAGASIAATSAYFELTNHPGGPSGAGTVSVVDDAGRTVSVPVNPSHVVVFGPNIVDSLVRLGLRADLVGVDCSSAAFGGLLGDYTSNQTQAWNLSSSMCVEALPSIDTEELLNKSPDLILATSIVSTSALEEFSTTYHVPLLWLTPTSLSGIVVDIGLLAEVFPSTTAAGSLTASLQSELAAASGFDANLSIDPNASVPSVLLTYYVDPSAGYYTYGPGTFGDALITLAGGVSVSRGAGVPYPVESGSDVLSANPSFVICGVGSLGEPISSYAQGPDWSQLTGTKVPMEVELFTEADPTMILVGLPELTNVLHPVG